MFLQVSDAETLLDDSRSFTEQARAGVDVRLDVFAGQQHTFQMAAGRSPIADDAIQRLADWVRPTSDCKEKRHAQANRIHTHLARRSHRIPRPVVAV